MNYILIAKRPTLRGSLIATRMILLIGDVHGQFEQLAHRLAVRKIRDAVLIQVGDFGLGFSSTSEEALELKSLNKTLKTGNNVLYVIRGNHDDPSYFEKETKMGNICLLPDYSVIKGYGHTVLLVGGAISIDRNTLISGKNYWKEEGFRFDEAKLTTCLQNIQNVDIIVTHNAPKEFWPFSLSAIVHSYIKNDSNLAAEREQHSRLLEFVVSRLAVSHWYYGHFHATNDGKYSNMKYYALDECEIREHLSL